MTLRDLGITIVAEDILRGKTRRVTYTFRGAKRSALFPVEASVGEVAKGILYHVRDRCRAKQAPQQKES